MRRSRRKDIRRDQFVDGVEKILKWGLSHRDRALTIIIGIIAAVVIGYSILTPKENFNPQAELILFQAKELMGIGKFEDSEQLLTYLIQNFGNTSSGVRGYYYLGVIHSATGKFEEALKDFDRYLGTSSKSFILKPSAYVGRGGAREATGDLEGAYEDYKKAAESKTAVSIIARLEMGRVAGLLGRIDEAESILDKIIDEEAGSTIADDARLYLGYIRSRSPTD